MMRVPYVKPSLYLNTGRLATKFELILASGELSGVNHYVRMFERELEKRLNVASVTAVSSGTSALILMLKAYGIENCKVIVPSFTFSATISALYWNNCEPVFVDIDPKTFCIDHKEVIIALKEFPDIKAIIGVHIFGEACNMMPLEEIAKSSKIKLFFDSAHALGALCNGEPFAGRGNASAFSLSPTKLLTSLEGGLVATNDRNIGDKLKYLRNYGIPEYKHYKYKLQTFGLNARMSEISGMIGYEELSNLDLYVQNRNKYAYIYKNGLKDVPGISFQESHSFMPELEGSCYKDFAIIIDPIKFKTDSEELMSDLETEYHINTKQYFHPTHQMVAFQKGAKVIGELENTQSIWFNIVCLPIWNVMGADVLNYVIQSIKEVYNNG